MVFEGVSLVSNYRSQFSRIIHESGYAELVKRLKGYKVSRIHTERMRAILARNRGDGPRLSSRPFPAGSVPGV